MRRNNAPYWIITIFRGRCRRCKLGIRKGEQAFYNPRTGELLCAGQDCGRREEHDLRENQKDAVMFS